MGLVVVDEHDHPNMTWGEAVCLEDLECNGHSNDLVEAEVDNDHGSLKMDILYLLALGPNVHNMPLSPSSNDNMGRSDHMAQGMVGMDNDHNHVDLVAVHTDVICCSQNQT